MAPADREDPTPGRQHLLEAVSGGVWVLDGAGATEFVGPDVAALLGFTPGEMIGRSLRDFLPPTEEQLAEETLARRRRGIAERRDLPLLRRDGSRVWALVEASPIPGRPGSGGSVLRVTDVSARRRAELALRHRARHEAAVAGLAHRALLGAEIDELLGEALGLLARGLGCERAAAWERLPGDVALRRRAGVGWPAESAGEVVGAGTASHPGFVLAAGETVVIDNLLAEERFSTRPLREQRVLSGAGTVVWRPGGAWGVLAAYSTRLRFFEPEEVDFLVAVACVVAAALERERERTELRTAWERFDLLGRATGDVIWDRDVQRGAAWYSPAFHAVLGTDPREGEPTVELWVSLVDPGDRERVVAGLEAALAGPDVSWSDEYRLRRPDGGRVEVFDRALILRDAEGRAVRAIGAMTDLTARTAREEARERARDQAALGRLAGGIAHDLNNHLTPILGFAELLLAGLPEDDPRRGDVREIRAAAGRCTRIVHRLLALGGEQLLRPERLAVDELVARLEPAVRAATGEGIRLVTILGAGGLRIHVDPGRLEEALLELVANARRAMSEEGELTIETAAVELREPFASGHGLAPGRHVMIAVTDAGEGMDAETRARAFEPFFTTRDRDTAAGLGLASVYGLVRQSGGGVSLHSDLGRGTTVKLYFRPAGDDGAEGAAGGVEASRPGGT